MVDIRDGGVQLTFEEAQNRVEQQLRQEREPNLARQRAQEIVNQAKTAAEFQALLKAEGIEVKNDTNLNTLQAPGAASGGLQTLQAARTAALSLKEGEVGKTPVKFGAGYLVLAATKRTEPDLSKLASEREGIRQRMLSERQQVTYDTYLKETRKRYEQEGKIRVYQDRIDNFFSRGAQ